MSTFFYVLILSTNFFEKHSTEQGNFNNSFHLPIFFQRYIEALFFCPDERLDNEKDMRLVRGDNFNSYFKTSTDLSKKII